MSTLGACLDYIPPNNTSNCGCAEVKVAVSRRRLWLVVCLIILPVVLAIGGLYTFKRVKSADSDQLLQAAIANQNGLQIAAMFSDKLADGVQISLVANAESVKPVIVTIRHRDNLKKILKRNGLNEKNIASILSLKQAKALRDLHAGRKLTLVFDTTKTKLQELTYNVNDLNTLVVTAANSGWAVKTKHIEPTTITRYATATINGSIYAAAKKVGISHKLMAQFVNAFSNKINANKICHGDSFSLFYKEFIVNGRNIRDNEIVAAELIHKGRVHRVISFTDPHGGTNFYTPDGHSTTPTFSRYPVSFRRISSHFSLARVHPIFGIVRPHTGVDFAASTGSPVKATSNGKVDFVGNQNGYGRTIIIKRGIYSTLYAHLSGFSKHIRSGGYVKRGEVIGYVGSSGSSTSPHLHYEFRVNGVAKDPLRVTLPSDEMIAAEYRGHFFAHSRKILAQLDSYRKGRKVFAMSAAG